MRLPGIVALILAPVLLIVPGCSSGPGRLLLVVESNIAIPAPLAQVRVRVEGLRSAGDTETSFLLGTEPGTFRLPLSLVVAPGHAEAEVAIHVEGLGRGTPCVGAGMPAGCISPIVSSTTIVRGFPSGPLRVLRVFLSVSCTSFGCTADSTCTEGRCVLVPEVALVSLPIATGPGAEFDVGTRPDARADAATDAAGDARLDAPLDARLPDAPSVDARVLDARDAPDARVCAPTETCNGLDDDCDTMIDDGFACPAGASGACSASCGTTGRRTCSAACAWGACAPPTETCNAIDDDCDGTIDDGFTCRRGMSEACTNACGVASTRTCSTSCSWGTCVAPTETCNGMDDDCDMLCDDGFGCCAGAIGACTATCGSTGSRTCSAACAWGACTAPAETCDGLDDDCDTMVDEGFTCTEGAVRTCVTSCGSMGTERCTSSCEWDTACVPFGEVCGNGVDEDCSGMDEPTCAVPPNDTCTAPIALTGMGSRMDTLVGAAVDAMPGCGAGPDLYYSVTVATPSVVWISTLDGTAFDTAISYRGTTCAGASVRCEEDPCGAASPAQIAQIVAAGTHYFAIAGASATGPVGPVAITYGVFAAAGGTNTLLTPLPGMSTVMGTTVGATSRVTPTCGSSTAGEAGYHWLQCPGDRRLYSFTTCSGASWDTVLHLRFGGTSIGCNDDGCSGLGTQSTVTAWASGAGLVQAFVDGYGTATGAYTARLTF